MATNRELLKEAIAEAKAVKEMAIANAKSALEESFTPRIKEMLSAKLQEMEEEETNEAYSDMDPEGPTAHGNVEEVEDIEEEELDLDELLAELDEEEEPLNEAEEAEDESEDDESEDDESEESEEEEEGEPLDLEDMTDEDLKKMIEDVISDMVESGELESGDTEGEEEEMEDESGMVDIEELLKEIEEEEVYEEKEDLQEFSFGLNDTEAIISMIAPALAIATGFAVNAIRSRLAKAKSAKELKAEMERLAKEAEESPSSDLEEAHSTIESLRKDLNEVNLLNAKLLYTNKVFKSKNLNESQKVKVLNAFDNATNVKETKLVYETLIEGLKQKTGKTVKESLGSASKSIITENAKSPIITDDKFSRMRELAFYNPKH